MSQAISKRVRKPGSDDHSVQKMTPYRVVSVLVLIVLAVLFTFPLYWIITGSFKDAQTINSATPVWFPLSPKGEHNLKIGFNETPRRQCSATAAMVEYGFLR